MATTWPTRTVDGTLSGDGAKVLGRDLWDRDQCVKQAGSTQYVTPDKTTTSTTLWGATLFTFGIRYPNFIRSGELVRLTLWMKNSVGGTSVAHFRIADVASSTFGTDASTNSTTLTLCTSALTVPDGWYGTYRTITVQGYNVTGGTLTVSTEKLCANLRFGD
jgi:hypothetical protein